MSNEVELPLNWPQDVLMCAYPDEGGNVVQSVQVSDYIAALSQIATLAAQVEELTADLKRGLNVEFQRTTCCVCGVYKHTPVRNGDLGGHICGGCLERAYEKAEAELAALKEEWSEHLAEINDNAASGKSWAEEVTVPRLEKELAALREKWEERYRRPYGERTLND